MLTLISNMAVLPSVNANIFAIEFISKIVNNIWWIQLLFVIIISSRLLYKNRKAKANNDYSHNVHTYLVLLVGVVLLSGSVLIANVNELNKEVVRLSEETEELRGRIAYGRDLDKRDFIVSEYGNSKKALKSCELVMQTIYDNEDGFAMCFGMRKENGYVIGYKFSVNEEWKEVKQ